MQFKIAKPLDNRHKLVGVYEDKSYKEADLMALKNSGQFTGKRGEVFYCTSFKEQPIQTVYIGLGLWDKLTSHEIKNAFAKGAKHMKSLKIEVFEVEVIESINLNKEQMLEDIVEGIRLGLYSFEKYKTDYKAYSPEVLLTHTDKLVAVEKVIEKINHLVEGMVIARDLVNEPANALYPKILADKTKELGQEAGFEVDILDQEAVNKLRMKAFLTVGGSSRNEPKLIVMRYFGDKTDKEVVGFVGKGVTCDTGGYCLKPSNSMLGIKGDMAGAAAVIGAVYAAAKNKIEKNVIGVIASCENKITDISYVPGDIIGSMAGKSIEIINTDGEGRLTLADAVTYAIREEKASKIIDIATLTGAVVGALGFNITGVVSNHDEFCDELIRVSHKSQERVWRFPIDEEHRRMIKSKVADLRNSGGSHSGTITAGLFIEAFVEDKPWIHLDIAGTAWTDSPNADYIAAGATGVGVKTLYYLLEGVK